MPSLLIFAAQEERVIMKYSRDQLNELIPLLRFGSTQPKDFGYRWLSYRKISEMTGRSMSYVRTTCLDLVHSRTQTMSKYKIITRSGLRHVRAQTWRRSGLTNVHLNYITRP